jgi:hypothetical protein
MSLVALPSEPTWPYYRSADNGAPFLEGMTALTSEELSLYVECRAQLQRLQPRNQYLIDVFESSNLVRQLDIAVPPHLQDLKTVTGWGGVAIATIHEDTWWDNYVSKSGDLMGLDEMADATDLTDVADRSQLEALITGVGFEAVWVGNRDNDEPEILVTAESPLNATVVWDYRARRPKAGLARTVNRHGQVVQETLYLPNSIIVIERENMKLTVKDRLKHNLNRVLLHPMRNNSRPSMEWGATELTPGVIYSNDAAVRTLLGMEINREFYTTPQRWIMGADMSMFQDENGQLVSQWRTIAGQMLAAPRPEIVNEDGEVELGDAPSVGQFQANGPQPFLDQIRGYAVQFAVNIAVSPTELGYVQADNPASADAIRAAGRRREQRARRRMRGWSKDRREIAKSMLLLRKAIDAPSDFVGRIELTPAEQTNLAGIEPAWTDPSAPTPAADADMAVKLVAEGILLPDSEVTYRKLRFSDTDIKTIEREKRARRSELRVAARTAAAQQVQANPRLAELTQRTEELQVP